MKQAKSEEARSGPHSSAGLPAAPWMARGALLLALAAGLGLIALFGLRTAVGMGLGLAELEENLHGETAAVQGVLWAARGEPVYRPLGGWDAPIMLHGPLAYYAPAWLGAARDAATPPGFRMAGRLGSLACYLLAGLLVAEIVHRQRRREGRRGAALWPLLGAMLFWVFAPQPALAVTVRAETLHLLLGLLALRMLMAFDARDTAPAWALVLLGLLLLVPLDIRQTVAAPLVTVVLWLQLRGRWVRAVVFGAAVAGTAIALLWLADLATGGHFAENLLAAAEVEFRLHLLRERLEQALPYLVLLGPPALVWCWSVWQAGRLPAFSLYPFAAFPFALLLGGRTDASPAPYWETLTALAPGAALGLERLWSEARERWSAAGPAGLPGPEAGVVAATTLLAALALGALAGNNLIGHLREERPTLEEVQARIEAIATLPEPVYGLPLTWPALMAADGFVSADLFQHDLMVEGGSLSWEPVTGALRTGEFPVLAVDDQLWERPGMGEIIDALTESYVRDEERSFYTPRMSFWRPREESDGGLRE